MHGIDARRRRSLPKPTRQRGNGRLLACDDDLDSAVGEILDPAVETRELRLLGGRAAIVNALDTAGDQAANRLARAHTQSAESRACVERSAETARFFARTAFMRAGP